MSTREWDLLSRWVRTGCDGLAAACRELALAVGAERLYCVVETRVGRRVYAFDYEGYPVASADTRLQPDLIQAALDAASHDTGLRVVRRAALDVRGAAAAAALELAGGGKLALVLEHRFGGAALASLDDSELGRWLTLCALAYQLDAASTAPSQREGRPMAARTAAERSTPKRRSPRASIGETSAPSAPPSSSAGAVPHPTSALYAAVTANETGAVTGLRIPSSDALHLAAELLPSVRLPEAPRAANGGGSRDEFRPSEQALFSERLLFPSAPPADSDEEDGTGFGDGFGDADEPLPSPEELEASLGALQNAGWNISQAARQLGMTRHGLKKRMRRLGIRRPPGLTTSG